MKKSKKLLYDLIEKYLNKQIKPEHFCDDFFEFYHEVDSHLLSKREEEIFSELAERLKLFSPYESDLRDSPDIYIDAGKAYLLAQKASNDLDFDWIKLKSYMLSKEMKYLTLVPHYTQSCLSDDFTGPIDFAHIPLSFDMIEKLERWNDRYKMIFSLSENEKIEKSRLIHDLDQEGLQLSLQLQSLLNAKVKYFSEGLLKYLPTESQDNNT